MACTTRLCHPAQLSQRQDQEDLFLSNQIARVVFSAGQLSIPCSGTVQTTRVVSLHLQIIIKNQKLLIRFSSWKTSWPVIFCFTRLTEGFGLDQQGIHTQSHNSHSVNTHAVLAHSATWIFTVFRFVFVHVRMATLTGGHTKCCCYLYLTNKRKRKKLIYFHWLNRKVWATFVAQKQRTLTQTRRSRKAHVRTHASTALCIGTRSTCLCLIDRRFSLTLFWLIFFPLCLFIFSVDLHLKHDLIK